MLLANNGLAPPVTFPPITDAVVGHATAVGDDPAECPACGGLLDLSQPDVDDHDAAQLVGCCVDCRRISLVIDLGSDLHIAILLPTRETAGLAALAAIAANHE
jgi:hypothetical protein